MYTKTNNYNKKKQTTSQKKQQTTASTQQLAPRFATFLNFSGLENDLTLEPMMVHLPVELLWRSLGRPEGQGDKVKVADLFWKWDKHCHVFFGWEFQEFFFQAGRSY